MDYIKFRTLLLERYGVSTAYIFIGYLPGNEERYRKFQEAGYTLIFKPVVKDSTGRLKGNCDAELVLQATRDVFETAYDQAVIVTSDGDFACLINFLESRQKIYCVISPRNQQKCSTLIKKLSSKFKLVFLPELRSRIEK